MPCLVCNKPVVTNATKFIVDTEDGEFEMHENCARENGLTNSDSLLKDIKQKVRVLISKFRRNPKRSKKSPKSHPPDKKKEWTGIRIKGIVAGSSVFKVIPADTGKGKRLYVVHEYTGRRLLAILGAKDKEKAMEIVRQESARTAEGGGKPITARKPWRRFSSYEKVTRVLSKLASKAESRAVRISQKKHNTTARWEEYYRYRPPTVVREDAAGRSGPNIRGPAKYSIYLPEEKNPAGQDILNFFGVAGGRVVDVFKDGKRRMLHLFRFVQMPSENPEPIWSGDSCIIANPEPAKGGIPVKLTEGRNFLQWWSQGLTLGLIRWDGKVLEKPSAKRFVNWWTNGLTLGIVNVDPLQINKGANIIDYIARMLTLGLVSTGKAGVLNPEKSGMSIKLTELRHLLQWWSQALSLGLIRWDGKIIEGPSAKRFVNFWANGLTWGIVNVDPVQINKGENIIDYIARAFTLGLVSTGKAGVLNPGRGITLKQAKSLGYGDHIYARNQFNADGSQMRFKVNGKPKTWKKEPNRVRVSLKRGLYEHLHMTENDLGEFTLFQKNPKRVRVPLDPVISKADRKFMADDLKKQTCAFCHKRKAAWYWESKPICDVCANKKWPVSQRQNPKGWSKRFGYDEQKFASMKAEIKRLFRMAEKNPKKFLKHWSYVQPKGKSIPKQMKTLAVGMRNPGKKPVNWNIEAVGDIYHRYRRRYPRLTSEQVWAKITKKFGMKNPGIPTKEAFQRVYPGAFKSAKARWSKLPAKIKQKFGSPRKLAHAIVGSVWYKKMGAAARSRYEKIRRLREPIEKKMGKPAAYPNPGNACARCGFSIVGKPQVELNGKFYCKTCAIIMARPNGGQYGACPKCGDWTYAAVTKKRARVFCMSCGWTGTPKQAKAAYKKWKAKKHINPVTEPGECECGIWPPKAWPANVHMNYCPLYKKTKRQIRAILKKRNPSAEVQIKTEHPISWPRLQSLIKGVRAGRLAPQELYYYVEKEEAKKMLGWENNPERLGVFGRIRCPNCGAPYIIKNIPVKFRCRCGNRVVITRKRQLKRQLESALEWERKHGRRNPLKCPIHPKLKFKTSSEMLKHLKTKHSRNPDDIGAEIVKGAASGAMAGSVLPGPGTAVGAAVGAASAAAAQLAKQQKPPEQKKNPKLVGRRFKNGVWMGECTCGYKGMFRKRNGKDLCAKCGRARRG
jgi:hypothetical protein